MNPGLSPNERVNGVQDPTHVIESLRKLRRHIEVRAAMDTAVRKGADPDHMRLMRLANGQQVLVDAAKIRPVVQKATARKPMLPCYDDDGDLVGAIDPGKVNEKAKTGDEALLDVNGSVFGYANARDLQALSSARTKPAAGPPAKPAPRPAPASGAVPSVEQVQKAQAVVAGGSDRVSDAEFMRAVRTLERYQARKGAR